MYFVKRHVLLKIFCSEDLKVGYIYVIKVYEHKSILHWLVGRFIHDQIKGLDFKFLENSKIQMNGTMAMT